MEVFCSLRDRQESRKVAQLDVWAVEIVWQRWLVPSRDAIALAMNRDRLRGCRKESPPHLYPKLGFQTLNPSRFNLFARSLLSRGSHS